MALIHKLSARAVESLVNQKKVGKHADGGGLYLQIMPTGGALWRYKFRIEGREQLAAFGSYPDVSLVEARAKHAEARQQVAEGDHPVAVKRTKAHAKAVERAASRPFAQVAQEWLDEIAAPLGERSKSRMRRCVAVLSKAFGSTPVAEVRLSHLTGVLLTYQRAGKHETRRRVQQIALSILGMAQDRAYIEINTFLSVSFKRGYTAPGSVHKKRPAITDAREFGRLLRDVEKTPDLVRRALRLLTLVVLRPGELTQAQWSWIDWDKRVLVVPFAVLKMRTARKGSDAEGRNLMVPLSRQALAELKSLHGLTGASAFLFPRQRDHNKRLHLGEESLSSALNRLYYKGLHCPHGFRSSFSTLLNAERRVIEGDEVLRWPDQKALIELQLDHNDASVQALYDRGGRLKERTELMQLWADRVDEMRQRGPSLRLVQAA